MTSIYLDKPKSLRELLDAVSKASADWYKLGMQLDMDPDDLNAIKQDHQGVGERMTTMLHNWLNKYPERGWSDIVSALRGIGRNDIADQVASRYCKSVSINGM